MPGHLVLYSNNACTASAPNAERGHTCGQPGQPLKVKARTICLVHHGIATWPRQAPAAGSQEQLPGVRHRAARAAPVRPPPLAPHLPALACHLVGTHSCPPGGPSGRRQDLRPRQAGRKSAIIWSPLWHRPRTSTDMQYWSARRARKQMGGYRSCRKQGEFPKGSIWRAGAAALQN